MAIKGNLAMGDSYTHLSFEEIALTPSRELRTGKVQTRPLDTHNSCSEVPHKQRRQQTELI